MECCHEYKCKQHKHKLVLYQRTIRSEEHTAELHSDPLISPLTDVSVSPQQCLSLFFFMFLSAMEERARQRAERRREIEEQRRQKQEEKLVRHALLKDRHK